MVLRVLGATLLLLMHACSINKYPEFIKVGHLRITESTATSFRIESDLIFYNPNSLGGILQINDIQVLINDLPIGTITSPDFKVPASNEFTVPITYSIPLNGIFSDKKRILNSIFNTLVDKEIKIQYLGEIHYKFGLISYDYPIEYTGSISLKKNND